MSSIVVSAVRDDALARSVCTRNAQCEPPRRCHVSEAQTWRGVHESDQRSPASEGRGGRVGGTFSAPRGSQFAPVVCETCCEHPLSEGFEHPV